MLEDGRRLQASMSDEIASQTNTVTQLVNEYLQALREASAPSCDMSNSENSFGRGYPMVATGTDYCAFPGRTSFDGWKYAVSQDGHIYNSYDGYLSHGSPYVAHSSANWARSRDGWYMWKVREASCLPDARLHELWAPDLREQLTRSLAIYLSIVSS